MTDLKLQKRTFCSNKPAFRDPLQFRGRPILPIANCCMLESVLQRRHAPTVQFANYS